MQYTTERLDVKPLEITDQANAIALFMDSRVKETYMLPDFADRDEAAALFDRLMKLSAIPNRYISGIYWQHQLIGLINETDVQKNFIEIGYAIRSEFWGKGFATEALQGAIHYLFAEGFSAIMCGAFIENKASMRVMEKSGMRAIEHCEEIEYRGKTHQCVYYSITKT